MEAVRSVDHAFCRDHHLTRSNFDRWRRILAADSGTARTVSAPAFVPLHVTAEPMAKVVLRMGDCYSVAFRPSGRHQIVWVSYGA